MSIKRVSHILVGLMHKMWPYGAAEFGQEVNNGRRVWPQKSYDTLNCNDLSCIKSLSIDKDLNKLLSH